MLAWLGFERRHVRAVGVFVLLFSFVVLGGAASHIVQRGETLGEIAVEHGVTVRELVAANGIRNPDLILIGQNSVHRTPVAVVLPFVQQRGIDLTWRLVPKTLAVE